MIQRILRVTLTVLALLLTLVSFQGLKKTNATTAAGLCDGICGCPGGSTQCCTYQGVTCYTAAPKPKQPILVATED